MNTWCRTFGCKRGLEIEDQIVELDLHVSHSTCTRCGDVQERQPIAVPKLVRRRAIGEPSSHAIVADLRKQLAECKAALEPFAMCFGKAGSDHPDDVVITDHLTDEDFERAHGAHAMIK